MLRAQRGRCSHAAAQAGWHVSAQEALPKAFGKAGGARREECELGVESPGSPRELVNRWSSWEQRQALCC